MALLINEKKFEEKSEVRITRNTRFDIILISKKRVIARRQSCDVPENMTYNEQNPHKQIPLKSILKKTSKPFGIYGRRKSIAACEQRSASNSLVQNQQTIAKTNCIEQRDPAHPTESTSLINHTCIGERNQAQSYNPFVQNQQTIARSNSTFNNMILETIAPSSSVRNHILQLLEEYNQQQNN